MIEMMVNCKIMNYISQMLNMLSVAHEQNDTKIERRIKRIILAWNIRLARYISQMAIESIDSNN